MQSIKQLVRGNYQNHSARELLQQPISSLLGVSQEVEGALADLSIYSVFDLAVSKVFNTAYEITRASEGEASIFTQHGFAPSDSISDDLREIMISELASQSIEMLNGIDPENRAVLTNLLESETIRDFSYWSPFQAARLILSQAFGSDTMSEDADAPDELLPKAGEYATEKSYYSSIFFDSIQAQGSQDLIDLDTTPQQLDIAALGNSEGFTEVATGAIFTFEQAWYPEGLSLGQLLHSLALAPAESTKIAVIDWSRETSSSTSEEVSQKEFLSNNIIQDRAVGETIRAVGQEMQTGQSRLAGSSLAYNKGSAKSVAGTLPIASGGFSESEGFSVNTYDGIAISSSKGRRSISASSMQKINSRTQQNASSVRNRRAAIIREVSQSESESITTRTVTNYNHSHALSVHYYEVVQVYRTLTRLMKCERCIFIPMKRINFNDTNILYYYQSILRRSVPPRLRKLFNNLQGIVRFIQGDDILETDINNYLSGISIIKNWELIDEIRIYFLNENGLNRKNYKVSDSKLKFDEEYAISQIQEIHCLTEGGPEYDGPIELTIELNFVQYVPYTIQAESLEILLILKGWSENRMSHKLLQSVQSNENISHTSVTKQLADKLNENSTYYSQLIWNNLSSQEVSLLLSSYSYKGKRLVEYTDTQPLAIHGNYIVLKYNDEEDESWQDFKEIHVDLNQSIQQTVPMATGGTFAEAVLGRSNASEKLDITRFWNWQESPIPIQAPDIAPIQTGSRKEADNTTPGRLDAPVVNIMNPPSLPDPQGMSAVLSAISSSNMFRDMSGLAATASLAQQALKGSSEGATAVSAQAGQNLKTAADLEKARLEMVGKLLGGSLSKSGISKIGALLNHGAKLDSKKIKMSGQNPESSGFDGAQPDSSSTFPSEDSNTSKNNFDISDGTTGSYEVDAFQEAIGSDFSVASATESTLSKTSVDGSLPDLSDWKDLISFRPLHSVQSAMIVASHKLQPLEKGYGDVNLDYYPVEIRKFPTVNGKVLKPGDFLSYFRLNINNFVESGSADFKPYDPASGKLWKSQKPIDSVISIKLLQLFGKSVEKGSVVVSDSSSDYWIFSTVRTSKDGWHPVSGNRQFGIEKGKGSKNYVFYTKGADRVTTFVDQTGQSLFSAVFSSADKLWVSMQKKIADYINANGGDAVVSTKTSNRYKWDSVKKSPYFKPTRTWVRGAIQ